MNDLKTGMREGQKKRIDWLNHKAWILRRIAPAKSIKAAEFACAMSSRYGYDKGLGEALLVMGVHNGYMGRLAGALQCYEEARRLLEAVGADQALARVYNSIGFLYKSTGHYERALAFLLRSAKLSRDIRQLDTAILSLYNLSEIEKELGKSEEALGLLAEAETYCIDDGAVYLPQILASEAFCFYRLGQTDRSDQYVERAMEAEKDCADPMATKQCRHIIGQLFYERGNYESVIEVIQKSMGTHQGYVHTYGLINDCLLLAKAYFAIGDMDRAWQYSDKALGNAHQMNMDYFVADIHQQMGEIYAKRGDYRSAYAMAQQVIVDNAKKHTAALENQIAIMSIEMKTDRLKQEAEIHRLKNIELKAKSEALAEAIEQLKQTQMQLVRQEKMAALGNLIAGLAHEINTPYGVIQAAVENIDLYAEKLLKEDYPRLLETLDGNDRRLFFRLLDRAMRKREVLSSAQEREGKRQLEDQLEGLDLMRRDFDDLCDMRLFVLEPEEVDFIRRTQDKQVLRLLHQLSGIMRNLANAKISVQKASKIIFALRDYAHFSQCVEATRFTLESTMMPALQLYESSMKHHVELQLDLSADVYLWGYPDELTQVWMNLIQNALQAMSYKGCLTITSSNREGHVEVTVADTGEGIDPSVAHRVFEPFFTTREKGVGSGMGLDLVKRIVEKHQGEVHFEAGDVGTRFIVRLPLAGKEKVNAP